MKRVIAMVEQSSRPSSTGPLRASMRPAVTAIDVRLRPWQASVRFVVSGLFRWVDQPFSLDFRGLSSAGVGRTRLAHRSCVFYRVDRPTSTCTRSSVGRVERTFDHAAGLSTTQPDLRPRSRTFDHGAGHVSKEPVRHANNQDERSGAGLACLQIRTN